MKVRIRKGDTVFIRTGAGRGKTGKVLHVFPKKQTVLVEGINVKKRHQRPSQKNPKGGILTLESPIHISNVAVYSASLGGPTKVSTQVIDDGGKIHRVRVDRKTGEQI